MNRKDIRRERIEKGKIIPLYYDFMITSIFNDPAYIDIVEYFVASYFGYKLEDIQGNIIVKTRDLALNNKKEKSKQVDIVLDYKGDFINIEINTESLSQGILKRNCLFVCSLHSKQLEYGEKVYTNIRKTIQLNFNIKIHNENEIVEKCFVRNEKGEIIVKDFEMDLLDVHKGEQEWYNGIRNGVIGWCALLKAGDKNTFNKILEEMRMPEIIKNKFTEKVEDLSSDEDNFQIYTKYSKREMTENTLRLEAELRGIEKGIEQGIEQKTKEDAINFQRVGVEKEKIMEALGISAEQLEEYLK